MWLPGLGCRRHGMRFPADHRFHRNLPRVTRWRYSSMIEQVVLVILVYNCYTMFLTTNSACPSLLLPASCAGVQFPIDMASALATAYLTCYNAAQSFGWALALVRLIRHVVETKSLLGGFSAAGDVVCFLQLSAFLEIVHSVLGLVRTGTLYAFMQWLGRSHVLFAIIAKIPEVQEQPPVMITFLAWSAAEVIRYPQYALGLMGLCPRWLTWLRYTAFIVLYPIGALYGEMLAMYLSLDFIKKQDLYASSFKWLPFDYHSFVVWVMIVYPFLWLLLYLHMFRQRKSKLSKKGSSGNRRKAVKPKRAD